MAMQNPSLKVFRFVYLFRLALAGFIILALLLTGCTASSNVGLSWQLAKGTNLEALVSNAIAKNTELSAAALSQTLVAKLPNELRGETHFLVDYNVPDVCGQLGCLYSIYAKQPQNFQQIWSGYFHPYLPKGQSLFSFIRPTEAFNFPCLEVRQMQKKLVQKFTYCFTGRNYQLTESKLLDTKRGKK